MEAVRTRLRAELRGRWRAGAGVALAIAVAGAVVLTAAAGARRTSSAYARFLRSSRGAQFLVSPNATGFPAYYRELQRGTGATVTPVIGYGASPRSDPAAPILLVASPDAAWGRTIERPKLIAGRMFRPDAGSEVVADVDAARVFHLHPGSRLHLLLASTEEELPDPAHDPKLTLTVTGIGVTRDSVVPANTLATIPNLLSGPGFARRFGAAYYAFDGAYVALPSGTSRPAFAAAAQRIARRFPYTGGGVFLADESEQAAKVEDAIRPQAVALALFAVFTALTALLAIGQVIARQLNLSARENDVLRALGMSRRQVAAVGLVEVGAVAMAGSLLAVALAIVASPNMPIGPARLAEPHPGVAVDGLVLGVGFVVVIAVFVAAALVPAWRASGGGPPAGSSEPVRPDTTRITPRAVTSAAPPSAAIGIGYAIDRGRGRAAVPMRSAIAVTALSLTALVAAMSFGANLSHLVGTPSRYGQSWDVTADAQFSPLPSARLGTVLRHASGVKGWTFGVHNTVTIAGQDIPTIGLGRGRGPLLNPTLVEGRAATKPGEIVLGTKTLERLHRRVGDTIPDAVLVECCAADGESASRHTRLRIVGRAVFPYFGEGSFTPTGLGIGAQVASRPHAGTAEASPANFVLVDVAAGPAHDAQVGRLERALDRGHVCGTYDQCSMTATDRPTAVLNYSRVQGTPVALAIVLALLAAGLVTNLLLTSIRRRRRDLAILKTLGFRRRQVSLTVAAQATTLVVIALAVGLPLGTLLGRWLWTTFATALGVPGAFRPPVLALVLTVPIALIVANVVAAGPGAIAGRTPPATALRTE